MKSQDRNADNLLIRLFTYTPRVGRDPLEDYCTEALAWCLRKDENFRREFLSLIFQPPLAFDINTVEIHTQQSFKFQDEEAQEEEEKAMGGRFDLVIHSSLDNDIVLVFEAKVGLKVSDDQIRKYRTELERGERYSAFKRRFLITITNSSHAPPGVDGHIRWPRIQAELENQSHEHNESQAPPNSEAGFKLIAKQFSALLKEKGMAPMKIRKTSPDLLSAFVTGMQFKGELEPILQSLKTTEVLGPLLRQKKAVYEKDQDSHWYGIHAHGLTAFYIAFVIRDPSKSPTLHMYIEREIAGDQRDVIKSFDPNLKKCSTDKKEPEFVKADNATWFHFEQAVDAEYEGNAEAIRDWFINTAEAVLKLGKSKT